MGEEERGETGCRQGTLCLFPSLSPSTAPSPPDSLSPFSLPLLYSPLSFPLLSLLHTPSLHFLSLFRDSLSIFSPSSLHSLSPNLSTVLIASRCLRSSTVLHCFFFFISSILPLFLFLPFSPSFYFFLSPFLFISFFLHLFLFIFFFLDLINNKIKMEKERQDKTRQENGNRTNNK